MKTFDIRFITINIKHISLVLTIERNPEGISKKDYANPST